jgi:NAD(P)-dependent dehydrogenase (short-subunit alcohol dehydrogenase family)
VKVIVITGSTRGIGFGLAEAFLARDCAVVISGRTAAAVEEAGARLVAAYGTERVMGRACDVRQFEQVQALWHAAVDRFGHVDVWINNAGLGNVQADFWDQPPDRVRAVVETNVVGAMYGAQVALAGMLARGTGSIYNLEGLGSDGRKIEGLTLYGTTKYGLAYLTDALAEEVEGTPVIVGALRPGMVVTDLLTVQYEDRPEAWERAKETFNLLADRVETVTPWLADRVLANERNGARFKWLNPLRLAGRFLMAPFRRRDLFEE